MSTWSPIHAMAMNTERYRRSAPPTHWLWPMLVGWMFGVVTTLVWSALAL